MPGYRHGEICATVTTLLNAFVRANKCGRVTCNDTFVQVGPESVFGADVFYISYQRQPKGEAPIGLTAKSPELVVEVRSPSETWMELVQNAEEYLESEVVVVILVHPDPRGVIVARNSHTLTLEPSDLLLLPDVLPGFSVRVGEFFE